MLVMEDAAMHKLQDVTTATATHRRQETVESVQYRERLLVEIPKLPEQELHVLMKTLQRERLVERIADRFVAIKQLRQELLDVLMETRQLALTQESIDRAIVQELSEKQLEHVPIQESQLLKEQHVLVLQKLLETIVEM
jgi:transcriptional/translational regulatory protein YebC/TACO1